MHFFNYSNKSCIRTRRIEATENSGVYPSSVPFYNSLLENMNRGVLDSYIYIYIYIYQSPNCVRTFPFFPITTKSTQRV